LYGGKIERIERQIHHYGSGLNALPLMSQFESDPDDIYLLRVAFGGLSGPMSNIDQGGFASVAFHSFADTLKWDAYSGDYGPNFVGHALNSGTYIIDHPTFGWQAFGGKVSSAPSSSSVQVQTLDSVRRRVFIAPFATLFTLDAGAFTEVEFDTSKKSITLSISAMAPGVQGAAPAPEGRLVVTATSANASTPSFVPTETLKMDAGAWVIPLKGGQGSVSFTTKK